MNQPDRLKLPSAYPGCPYQYDVALTGYEVQPTTSHRLYYGPGGRLVGSAGPALTVDVVNDPSHPTAFKARIQAAPTAAHVNDFWLELLVDGVLIAAGPFTVSYQTR